MGLGLIQPARGVGLKDEGIGALIIESVVQPCGILFVAVVHESLQQHPSYQSEGAAYLCNHLQVDLVFARRSGKGMRGGTCWGSAADQKPHPCRKSRPSWLATSVYGLSRSPGKSQPLVIHQTGAVRPKQRGQATASSVLHAD